MTLSLLAYPPPLAFARNNVFVRLQSNNYLASAGVNALAVITVLSSPYPVQDETLTFSWSSDISHSVTFTFKDQPDESGLQLPTRLILMNLQQYVAYLVLWFGKNQEIYKDFIIAQDDDDIRFTSRLKNVTSLTVTVTNCDGVTLASLTAGTLRQLRANFKAILEIYERDQAGTDTYLGTKSASPDDDGIILFDIANQIRPRLATSPTWPQSQFVYERADLVKNHYVRVAESYGDDPVIYGMSTQGLFNSIFGGAGKLKIASLNAQNLSLYDEHIVTRQRFLTFHPIVKVVDRYQPEKLYWYNYGSSYGTLKTKLTAIYTDGSTHEEIALFPIAYMPTLPGKVYEFRMSPDKLMTEYAWPPVTGHSICGFKLQILNGSNTPVSEERTYYIDNLPYQENRYFLFLNSLGGFDTLRCVGKFEKSGTYNRTEAIQMLSYNYTPSATEVTDLDITEAQIFKASTGWLSLTGVSGKQMADYLRELFLSPMVFQFTTAGLERIKITSGEVLIHSDNQQLYSLVFEYRKSFSDNLYAPSADDSMNADNAFFGTGWGVGFQQNINMQILNNT
jgi:hypothetical protein